MNCFLDNLLPYARQTLISPNSKNAGNDNFWLNERNRFTRIAAKGKESLKKIPRVEN
jgi:hypothetical protein